jgi:5-methylcytosine-specific restriction endonuclease McrA
MAKATSEFRPRVTDGLQSWCRPCERRYTQEYKRLHKPAGSRTRSAVPLTHEEVNAQKRRYYATHREKELARVRAFSQAHPERDREKDQRRRAVEHGAASERVSIAVLAERDSDRCGICHKPVALDERSVDHILPIANGGGHTYANTQLAHLKCNIIRSNRGPAQLRLVG